MFDHVFDTTRGGVSGNGEEYTDFPTYLQSRHTFGDMVYHEAELAAVRMAEIGIPGVFGKTALFRPDDSITVRDFVRGILQLENKADAQASDDDIIRLAIGDGLLTADPGQALLTREGMAGLLAAVCSGGENAAQYRLLMNDYDTIAPEYRAAACKGIALGVLPAWRDFCPRQEVTRAEAAQALHRMSNAGMRLTVPYDIGDAYEEGRTAYLAKNSFVPNEGGIVLGTWAGYNKQDFAFRVLGKRPVDRVDFHKWCWQEPEKGVYTFPQFGNEKRAHHFGNTVITSVEIAANLLWNPRFHTNMIPSFYKCDITDPETRQAAKNYLYAFVQAILRELGGDLLLSIDYETDWEMNLEHADDASKERARIWGKWYCEACETVRQAARDMGADGRVKLIIIYNNINELSRLGRAENQWMLDAAVASDIIGIDVYYYDLVKDLKDPSKFMQDMRYLINNYSLGKPVMVIENGIPVGGNGTDLDQYGYFKNLFREFQFVLEKGDYLNHNLNGYLFWDLIRGEGGSTGVFTEDGTPFPSGVAVTDGIRRLESIRQYNPTLPSGTLPVTDGEPVDITVESGTCFDQLTLVTEGTACRRTLRVKLAQPGGIFLTVNGDKHYISEEPAIEHNVRIPEGMVNGCNIIEIYFGADRFPFGQTVLSAELV